MWLQGLIKITLQESPRCLLQQTRNKYNLLLEWSITCPKFQLDCLRLLSPLENWQRTRYLSTVVQNINLPLPQMKKEIASAPILSYYNPKKQTVLQTDASTKGLGACLLQEEKPVSFARKSYQMHSRGYVAIELESLAVAWAMGEISSFPICKPFHFGNLLEALRSNFIQEH